MQLLTIEQTADYLEAATLEQSIDKGHAIVHIGINQAGAKFVLVDSIMGEGESALAESM